MPYNPGVVDRSGQLMGQGILGFGRGISRGIERRSENKEEDRRRLEQIKRMQKIASGLGMSDADVQEASIGDLEGFVDNMAIQRANQVHQAQMKKQRADIEDAVLRRQAEAAQLGFDREEMEMKRAAARRDQRGTAALNKAFMPMGPQRELTTTQRLAMSGAGTPQGFNTAMDADELNAELSKQAWKPSFVEMPGGRKAFMSSAKSANLVEKEDPELKIPFRGASFKENGVTWTWDDNKGAYKANVERDQKIDYLTLLILQSNGLISQEDASRFVKDQYLSGVEEEEETPKSADFSDPDVFFDY